MEPVDLRAESAYLTGQQVFLRVSVGWQGFFYPWHFLYGFIFYFCLSLRRNPAGTKIHTIHKEIVHISGVEPYGAGAFSSRRALIFIFYHGLIHHSSGQGEISLAEQKENQMVSEKKTAVIIGGGPAGLTAAYELLRQTDIHPIVLEQDDMLGGIARTVDFGGNRMDIGGHRFFTKSEEVKQLWHELLKPMGAPAYDDKVLGRERPLAPDGADPEEEDDVFLLRHRVSRILYLHKFFDYPVKLNAQTIRNLGLSRMLGIGCSYLHSCFHKREEKTLEDFMVNRFGEKLYETFFEKYTEKVWGKNPSALGADWGSQRIKGVSLAAVLKDFFTKTFHLQPKHVEASLIDRFLYPKYGPGELWETMAEKIREMGGEIHMGSHVTRLRAEDQDNGVKGKRHLTQVWYHAEDGTDRAIAADYVFSSMPIKDLVASLPRAWFSHSAHDVAAKLPYRDFMTAGVLVDKLLLRNETAERTLGNIVPDCWIYIQEPDVRIGRLQVFNNWSPYLVKDPEHTVWLEYFCTEGDDLWSMTDEAFLDFAVKELEKIHVIAPGAVKEGHVVRMKKAYPAYFGTYKEFPMLRESLDQIDNLFCIGRNGQHRYNNMDHSMLTAIEAVKVIKEGSKDKSPVWNVNTEKAYQEMKSEKEEEAAQ